jgi:hypothetical protein
VGNATWRPLAEYVKYLPRVQELGLRPEELRAIPVHPEPADDEEFLSLGEIPPGAPAVGPRDVPAIGTRQLYAYRSEVSPALWERLGAGLKPRQPSGTGAPGMFGNPAEEVVDEENPQLSWRNLDAGESLAD